MQNTPLHILLVEDNPADARFIELLLTERHPTALVVERADTLGRALSILERAEGRFSVILLDLGLPDSNSIETLRAVSASGYSVPIVVLSGLADETLGIEAVREGAQDYLVKGRIDAELLARTVRYSIERHRVESALRESESPNQRILDVVPGGVVEVNMQGQIESANTVAQRLLGLSLQELRRLNIRDFTSCLHEDGSPCSAEDFPISRCLTTGTQQQPMTLGVPGRAGAVFWAVYTAIPMTEPRTGRQTGAVVTFLDITEHRRSDESLRASEARYRAVVEDQTELVCRFRPDGTRTFVNEACCRFFGLSRDELIGANLFDTVVPADREAVRAHIQSLTRVGPAQVQEQRVFSGTGEVRWHQWFNRVVHVHDGHPVELQGLGRDITAQKLAEQALSESAEQLRHAQKLDAVGMLASGVAHDFNNLLTAIRGYASLARATLEDGHPALESLDQVEEASRQATGVAGALLTFARKARTEKLPVELAATVESAVRLFRRTLPLNLRLVIDTARAANLWVLADATQLQQVVMNLGLNARDASKREGLITIIVEPVLNNGGAHGRPAGGEAPTAVRMIVSDTGSGISPDIKARIFEPFFTTKPRGRGTGLGLAVIHGIVQDHGGTISVESQPDRGAIFTVVLPLVPPPPRSAEPRRSSETAPLTGGLALLVEHNHLVRGLLASMLSALGYEVVHATTGAEALERMGSTGPEFDLLVTAQNIPDGDTGSLIRNLAKQGHHTRTIIVSGADPTDEATDSDVVVLRKPFQLADLRRAIVTLLADGTEDMK